MKKLMTFLCALLCCSAASAQETFRMSGQFSDVKNDTLAVEFVKREPDKEVVNLKVPVNAKGEFSFDCQMKYAYKGSLTLTSDKESAFFFFVPGEQAVVSGAFALTHEWKLSGSDFYRKLAKVMELRKPYLLEFDQSEADYKRGLAAGGDQKALKEKQGQTNVDINKRMGDFALSYLRQHPNEETSVAFVGDGALNCLGDELKLLSPEVRNGRFKSFLDVRQTLADRLAKAQKASQMAKKSIEVGKPAPDFTLKDLNGNAFTLSSMYHKGRYVIVDFWGSWCSWCIKGFPKMKEYAAKYKDKLDIVGVDCSDKEDKWKAAVAKYQMTWQQVRSDDGTTEVTFGVEGYPHKVVISPEGVALKMITGESDDFYQFLDDTLK
jgi:thiol-disulfide isomerase/thioredoxin